MPQSCLLVCRWEVSRRGSRPRSRPRVLVYVDGVKFRVCLAGESDLGCCDLIFFLAVIKKYVTLLLRMNETADHLRNYYSVFFYFYVNDLFKRNMC